MIDKVGADSGYQYPDYNRQGKSPSVYAYEILSGTKEAGQKKEGKEQKPSQFAKADSGVAVDISFKPAKHKAQGAGKAKAMRPWKEIAQKLAAPMKRAFQMLKDFWYFGSEDMQLPSLDEEIRYPAHNSDLLTYYNRKGKLVEMDESDKRKVLFGDKHALKL